MQSVRSRGHGCPTLGKGAELSVTGHSRRPHVGLPSALGDLGSGPLTSEHKSMTLSPHSHGRIPWCGPEQHGSINTRAPQGPGRLPGDHSMPSNTWLWEPKPRSPLSLPTRPSHPPELARREPLQCMASQGLAASPAEGGGQVRSICPFCNFYRWSHCAFFWSDFPNIKFVRLIILLHHLYI